ncbi:MAG TPA: superoxide dismutase [Lentimicrobium sp.]|nr:superoxide dismutase [Lentimicrobium sp.]
MVFNLPPLPYATNALEPVISEKTISFHYGKHHQAYVLNLNNLIKGTRFEDYTLEQIILEAEGPIFNNAAQVWNHTFFWESMAKGITTLDKLLMDAISEEYGSLDKFIEQFTEASVKLFGSGWVWLVIDESKKLKIIQTSNAGNPMTDGYTPLLTLDVWEHAYYLDYQNRRPDFIKSFWSIVNWQKVSARFSVL